MSLLTIVQNACDDLGISRPTTVIGNTDKQITQLLAICTRECRDLASRYQWQAMTKVNTFTLALTESQGAMNGTVVSTSDFDYILNETIWNRTLAEPIFGPVGASERQALAAFPVTGPYQRFWIRGGILSINPAPASADTAAFEYKSTHWCQSSGGTGQAAWAADTDTCKLDENIVTLGVIWRWLQRKGMDYAQDFESYESRVTDAMARDGGKPRLNMNLSTFDRMQGVFVPQGSWSV